MPAATWCEQGLEVRGVQYWCPRACLKLDLLGLQYIHFHPLEKDLVVELDDVDFGRILGLWVERHVCVHPRHNGRLHHVELQVSCLNNTLLVDLLVRVDYVIKLDFGGVSGCSAPVELDLVSLAYLDGVGVHLAYPINDAHNQLVQVPSSKEAYLLAQSYLDDGPDEFGHFLVYVKRQAQVLHRAGSNLEYAIEEDFQWPHLPLFLVFDSLDLLHSRPLKVLILALLFISLLLKHLLNVLVYASVLLPD